MNQNLRPHDSVDIDNKRKRLIELEKRKGKLYSMLADGKDEATINKLLSDDENERAQIEVLIAELEYELFELKKRLKTGENVKKIADKIVDLKDVSVYRELIKNTVSRIEINNIDKSISCIRITYVNGEVDMLLYSYPMLRNKYIYLDESLGLGEHFKFDGKSPVMTIEEGWYVVFLYMLNSFGTTDDDGLTRIRELESLTGEKTIRALYSDEISVRDFVIQARNGFPRLWEYDNSPFQEKDDERKEKQTAKYKEWRKKYNSGLPSSLPYAVRDVNYEEYLIQRKHLYNRKYKVKRNKKLSMTEKEDKLRDIDRQLSILKARVKYLTRDEAVKQYREKKK